MTKTVGLRDARKHLSMLVQEVARGAEVVITKAGRPLARLVPIRRPKASRRPGAWKGRVYIADDFDGALPTDLIEP